MSAQRFCLFVFALFCITWPQNIIHRDHLMRTQQSVPTRVTGDFELTETLDFRLYLIQCIPKGFSKVIYAIFNFCFLYAFITTPLWNITALSAKPVPFLPAVTSLPHLYGFYRRYHIFIWDRPINIFSKISMFEIQIIKALFSLMIEVIR